MKDVSHLLYTDGGETGRPILIIPGAWGNRGKHILEFWMGFLALMLTRALNRPVCILACPDVNDQVEMVHGLAARIREITREMPRGGFDIVGYSRGAYLSAGLAHHHPDLVHRLAWIRPAHPNGMTFGSSLTFAWRTLGSYALAWIAFANPWATSKLMLRSINEVRRVFYTNTPTTSNHLWQVLRHMHPERTWKLLFQVVRWPGPLKQIHVGFPVPKVPTIAFFAKPGNDLFSSLGDDWGNVEKVVDGSGGHAVVLDGHTVKQYITPTIAQFFS